MLNFKHLHYFRTVAKAGAINRAAEKLHLAPQTLSGQISLLEDRLGVALFRRSGRRLELTDAGRTALTYADEIFHVGAELEEALQKRSAARAHPFRVGIADVVPKVIAYQLLAPALTLAEPIRLTCKEGRLEQLAAELSIHRLDMVLADRPLPSNMDIKGYSHPLGECGIAFLAGHNGTTTAAYLAKCGLRVCVLEERPECGGAQETVEPMAGVRIQTHAIGNYGGAAPGWEQLELWRYGFRMDHDRRHPVPFDQNRGPMARHGIVPVSDEDKMGWAKITGLLAPPAYRDLLRATFWTPPHPSYVELDENTIPYMQVFRDRMPELWTKEMLEWTMFDLMDQAIESESF